MLIRKLIILGVVGGMILGSGFTVNTFAQTTPVPTPDEPAAIYMTYLPLMLTFGNSVPTPGQFALGAETINAIDAGLMSNLADAGGTWTRHTVLEWDKIEPTRTSPNPTYLWNKVNSGKEAELAAASAKGIEVIATIKYTPGWAQKYPGIACGPMAQQYFDEFAQFVSAAVARYKVQPYNIEFWEIGNEPDLDPKYREPIPGGYAPFGCWGDENDPTGGYGGGYYADMLKVVYPAIKAADPNAKVLIGGLLLDCDPANPPPNPPNGGCTPAHFLKGILSNGGAPFFDYVAYHGYAWWWPGNASNPPLIVDDTNTSWAHLGGVVVGKYNYLRSVMTSFGVDKPIILNEAGLVCPPWVAVCSSPPAQFYQDQADYLVRLFVRSISMNLSSTIWFTLEGPGWRYAGLFYDTQTTPKPAHDAMTFLTTELAGATYFGTVNQYTGVWGYEFRSNTKKIWVLGVPGSTGYTITLPSGPNGWLKVYNKYGAPVNPINNQVHVKSPIYVEFAP
jgi:hypothetical protein